MAVPLVSIITVSYNGKKHLKEFLLSLRKLKYPKFELILVDNNSSDDSVEFVKKYHKWVKLIQNKENLGFVGGNNIGIKKAQGKYIVLLNNDTKVEPNWLKELIKPLEENQKIAVTTSKVKLYRNKNLLNSAGIVVDIYGFGLSRGLPAGKKFERDIGQYNKREEIFSGYGAAMAFKKDLIKKIGYFNHDYEMYYEEIDFCWRARLAGYEILYVPSSVVYHKFRGSDSQFSRKMRYYVERNRLRTLLQNYSSLMLLKTIPMYLLLKTMESIFYISTGQFEKSKCLAGGIAYNILNIKKIFKQRKYTQKKIRKVSDKEIIKYMKPYSIELRLFLSGRRN